MSTLAHPSADFPRQPKVSFEVPEGWEPAHAPGTRMAVRLPGVAAFGECDGVGVGAGSSGT
jgi:hypothetical protein